MLLIDERVSLLLGWPYASFFVGIGLIETEGNGYVKNGQLAALRKPRASAMQSELLNVSDKTVSRWERGKGSPI